MQTFLPYSSFFTTAACLDYRRLGKQRVEARQILDILLGRKQKNSKARKGWLNHPAVRMWKGYELALGWYYNIILQEWLCRGFNNAMSFEKLEGRLIFPPWLGNPDFHKSHRANLLRKNPEYYEQFGWSEDPETSYFWPI